MAGNSIIIDGAGQIFAGHEDSIKNTPATAQSHELLGRFSMAKQKPNALNASFKFENLPNVISETSLNSVLAGKLRALAAAEGVANSENLTHLQLIRLFPQIQGMPETYFYLEEAYVGRDIPQLEFRESFYDTVQTAEYLDRLEQSKATKTVYDEIVYNLKKLVDKVYTPIEDEYRTIINPKAIDLGQINWGFKRKRNLSALEGIREIGNDQGTLGKFEQITGTNQEGFHSANRAATELNEKFNEFLKTNDVSITHVIMNTQTFTEYTENTWTKSGPVDMSPVRLAGGGVVPLPGIQGVQAIVDVHVPVNRVYCINKPNALRLGEGPKLMRRFYDEERDASAIKMIDFHEHISVNSQITKLDRKFGMTLSVTP